MNVKLNEYKDICPYFEEKCQDLQCACPKYVAYQKIQEPGAIEAKLTELNLNPDDDALNLMLGMQSHLAQLFHPVENLSKQDVDKWVDEYITCIEDELREVREHLGWKPWEGPSKNNVVELKKELIDIWHFMMDMMLVSGIKGSQQLFKLYCPNDQQPALGMSPQQYLEFIMNNERKWMSQYHSLENVTVDDRDWLVLFYQNCMQDALGAIRQQISWKHWKKPNDTINYERLHSALALSFKYLVDMMVLTEITAQEWKEVYVKKNVENFYRQEAGY